MIRECRGLTTGKRWTCDKPATVVVSAYLRGDRSWVIQWFACDNVEHHRYQDTRGRAFLTSTQPLAAWLARRARIMGR